MTEPLPLDDFSETARIGDTQSPLNKYLNKATDLIRNSRTPKDASSLEYYKRTYRKLMKLAEDLPIIPREELEEIINFRSTQIKEIPFTESLIFAPPINLSPYETIHLKSNKAHGWFLPENKQLVIHKSTEKAGYSMGFLANGSIIHDQAYDWAMNSSNSAIVVSLGNLGLAGSGSQKLTAYGMISDTGKLNTTAFITEEEPSEAENRKFESTIYSQKSIRAAIVVGNVQYVNETGELIKYEGKLKEGKSKLIVSSYSHNDLPEISEQNAILNEAIDNVMNESRNVLQDRKDSPAKIRSLSNIANAEFKTLREMISDVQ